MIVYIFIYKKDLLGSVVCGVGTSVDQVYAWSDGKLLSLEAGQQTFFFKCIPQVVPVFTVWNGTQHSGDCYCLPRILYMGETLYTVSAIVVGEGICQQQCLGGHSDKGEDPGFPSRALHCNKMTSCCCLSYHVTILDILTRFICPRSNPSHLILSIC